MYPEIDFTMPGGKSLRRSFALAVAVGILGVTLVQCNRLQYVAVKNKFSKAPDKAIMKHYSRAQSTLGAADTGCGERSFVLCFVGPVAIFNRAPFQYLKVTESEVYAVRFDTFRVDSELETDEAYDIIISDSLRFRDSSFWDRMNDMKISRLKSVTEVSAIPGRQMITVGSSFLVLQHCDGNRLHTSTIELGSRLPRKYTTNWSYGIGARMNLSGKRLCSNLPSGTVRGGDVGGFDRKRPEVERREDAKSG